MRIASFNINGVNGRLNLLPQPLESTQPDLVCLQELKSDSFPSGALRNAGYFPSGMGRRAGMAWPLWQRALSLWRPGEDFRAQVTILTADTSKLP
jgi:exonuclease III